MLGLLPAVRAALEANHPVLVTAEPGAGKTTLLPPALLDSPWLRGRKILVLEPRRVAARAAASRMAFLRGEAPGQTFGWRMAQDTKVGPRTRLEVVTEGVLTRMLQADPELADVGLVLFDEFHERSLHADLGLALCLEVRATLRPDLRLGLLSATLDHDLVRRHLPDVVAVHAPGRVFPLTTEHRPPPAGVDDWSWVARQVEEGWGAVAGSLLVFLPGAWEIRQVQQRLEDAASRAGELVQTLHGGLSARDQDAVLQPTPGRRKTVLATSVAETSVTIPDVELVLDSGWARLGRYDQARGLERLVTERASRASADQRRGRAGRTRPGQCWRLWPQAEPLDATTDPEILRADLAPLVLECAVWGARDRLALEWMTPPDEKGWAAACEQLRQLEALEQGRVTPLGRDLARLGVGPRVGRLLLKASPDQRPLALALAALLQDRERTASEVDLRTRVEQAAREGSPRRKEAQRLLADKLGWPTSGLVGADQVGDLLVWAYPDRVAFRVGEALGTFQLPSGRALKVTGPLAGEDTLVVAEADAGTGGTGKVWLAAPIDRGVARQALGPLVVESKDIEWSGWRPRAFLHRRFGALVFERTGLSLEQARDQARASLLERLKGSPELPWGPTSTQLVARLALLSHEGPADWTWLAEHADWSAGEVFYERQLTRALTDNLPWGLRSRLEAEAPESLVVPSGSRRKLDYRADGSIHLEVRIQEVFGLAATPRVAGKPVVLELLSPGHKPLQITADLASFWANTYPEVRKQMRGRYPRHYWPENPLEAEPTSRPKPRGT